MMSETARKVRLAMLSMARQCWEQGIAAQAMLETGDDEALILMARDCVTRQHEDGRLCVVENTPAIIDPAICVEPVLKAYELTGDESLLEAAMRNVGYLLNDAPRTNDGAVYQLLISREIWADSLGMGPHVLVLTGHPGEAVKLFGAVKRRLYDEHKGLFRHKWDEASGEFARPCFWAIGNGWALTGLMRMAQILIRQNSALTSWARDEFQALYEAVLPYQDESGGYHDVLDDPKTFLDTGFTEMFAYSTFNMVSLGMLPNPDDAFSRAMRARDFARSRVDSEGFVRGCAGSPDFEREGVSVECQAHYLMMESAFFHSKHLVQ